jgi:hypothetical protein
MKFINKCVPDLQVGILAEFDNTGLISRRENGRIIGVVSKVYQTQASIDDPTLINIAEITVSGWVNNVILSGIASWKGCDLYANGEYLSATPNGEVIAKLIPKVFGEDQSDFTDGELVTVHIR